MISISEEVKVASPPEALWPILRDPARVASCIPGASLTASSGDAYQGTMRVKFGPTIAIFRGEARLAYDDAARRCTIEGRGIDARGASRALASGVVTASGAKATVLRVEGNFNVTGPLETFANAGGVHLARALLTEFAQNIARLVPEQPVSAAAEDAPAAVMATPPPAADTDGTADHRVVPGAGASAGATLSAGRLIWRAFLGWFKQLFVAKGKTG
jgi:uncharacterized protein